MMPVSLLVPPLIAVFFTVLYKYMDTAPSQKGRFKKKAQSGHQETDKTLSVVRLFAIFILYFVIINLFLMIVMPENGRFGAVYAVSGASLAIILSSISAICKVDVSISPVERKPMKRWEKLTLFSIDAVILLASLILLFSLLWMNRYWDIITIEELIFHLSVPLKGTNKEMIYSFIKWSLAPAIFIFSACYFAVLYPFQKGAVVSCTVRKKRRIGALLPNYFLRKYFFVFSLFMLACVVMLINSHYDLIKIKNQLMTQSSFIEENFVDTATVELEFPEQKRNLIYIFVESLETSVLPVEKGGANDVNIIPELTQLAEENINFSATETLGGSHQTDGWTVAAMVAHTSGLPYKVPLEGNSYGQAGTFMPGVCSLGEILEHEGYKNVLMMGSDAAFGGRDVYFAAHGNYELLDYKEAKARGVIPPDYNVWWGFEDQKLYDWAKQEALALGRENQPFNLSLLTVDTHHVGGYVCELCTNEHSDQYQNVFSCASRQLYDFVEWIKQQDFYENTTIVITGDHRSMDNNYAQTLPHDYERMIFDIFINSAVTTQNTNNRHFGAYDLMPTTLAAMGVKISGDRLALGSNLFSDTPTLMEQYGLDYTSDELGKLSSFYNERFFKGERLR